MELEQIYQPIAEEIKGVEVVLATCLKQSKNESILKVNRFLLESPGKRLRPALVILSAKATLSHHPKSQGQKLIQIASAIELIHIASLIHDDVIDHACLRHSRPTVNSQWGQDVSIALGDYLYSLAFKLISVCGNTDILDCISSATESLCEGELMQVIERDNLSLSKSRYILIVKKKTASLFAASCKVGAMLTQSSRNIQNALKAYGLNFGIAFQIIDDYLDLMAEEERLGKSPGQDIAVGEITLPLLNLSESISQKERQGLIRLLKFKDKDGLGKLRERLSDSDALLKTKKSTLSYLTVAKEKLEILADSDYRASLFALTDLVFKKMF